MHWPMAPSTESVSSALNMVLHLRDQFECPQHSTTYDHHRGFSMNPKLIDTHCLLSHHCHHASTLSLWHYKFQKLYPSVERDHENNHLMILMEQLSVFPASVQLVSLMGCWAANVSSGQVWYISLTYWCSRFECDGDWQRQSSRQKRAE